MTETNHKKSKNNNFVYAIGRRKEASARIRLYKDIKTGAPFKKGDILINDKRIEEYFPGELASLRYMEPLKTVDALGKFAFTIRVAGGGASSQMDAVIFGISRALTKLDEKYRKSLRSKGLLTTDARERERRKVGTGGKARRKKQSPKR